MSYCFACDTKLINARTCRTQIPTNRRVVAALLQQSEKCLKEVENYFNRQVKYLSIGSINKILHTYEGCQSPVLNIYSPPTFRCILSPIHLNHLCRAERHAVAIQPFDLGVLEKGCNWKLQYSSCRGLDLATLGIIYYVFFFFFFLMNSQTVWFYKSLYDIRSPFTPWK